MALKMDFDFKGLHIAGGIVRAAVVSANKNTLCACVTFHADASSQELFSEMYELPHDLDGPNALSQSYFGIKSLPRFATALDVFP